MKEENDSSAELAAADDDTTVVPTSTAPHVADRDDLLVQLLEERAAHAETNRRRANAEQAVMSCIKTCENAILQSIGDPRSVRPSEALRRIAAISNAADPQSYRNDDPDGASRLRI